MIPSRHKWLLRGEAQMFEAISPVGGTCKLCSVLDSRPGADHFVTSRNQARHLAAHRRERIVRDDQEAATIAAALELGEVV